jgi:hypothetical protein
MVRPAYSADSVDSVPDGYASAPDVAELLGVTLNTVYGWRNRGVVHCVTLAPRVRTSPLETCVFFNVEQARAYHARMEEARQRRGKPKPKSARVMVDTYNHSQAELRRHYVALYRTRLEHGDYYPEGFCGPEIEQLLIQGHAEAYGQGYRITWEGVKAWARMNEAMLKRKVSRHAVEWRELRQALNADM